MTIFKNKIKINLYSGKNKVLSTIRTDVTTAEKIDELLTVCIAETGNTNLSKNRLLVGIITNFIANIENTAKNNENEAVNKLLAILD